MKNLKPFSEFSPIYEQYVDDDMFNLLKGTTFRNCRGVKLGMGNMYADDMPSGISSKEARKIDRQTEKENRAEWKAFVKDNSLDKKGLDFDYYMAIKDNADRVRAFNMAGTYESVFDDAGKPFTKDTTQKVVNLVQSLFTDGAFWYLYWREVFGNKTPNKLDIYRNLESQGGKKKMEDLEKSNFDYKKYREMFTKAVEDFELELKKKFPFEVPKEKTKFLFVWGRTYPRQFRYFNTYEEWKLALEITKQEGNLTSSVQEDGGANEASADFPSKPIKGKATPALFK